MITPEDIKITKGGIAIGLFMAGPERREVVLAVAKAFEARP